MAIQSGCLVKHLDHAVHCAATSSYQKALYNISKLEMTHDKQDIRILSQLEIIRKRATAPPKKRQRPRKTATKC